MRLTLVIGLCAIALVACVIASIAYGHYCYPEHFQKRVPLTNMKGMQKAFGKPVCISTNPDGTIRWDYTHWWTGVASVYFDTNGNYFRTFRDL